MKKQNVLIFDVDEVFRRNLSKMLESNGFNVQDVSRSGEAVKCVLKQRFGVIVICIEPEDVDYIQILSAVIRYIDYKLPIIVISGRNLPLSTVSSFIHDSFRLFQKPVDCKEVVEAIREAVMNKANNN